MINLGSELQGIVFTWRSCVTLAVVEFWRLVETLISLCFPSSSGTTKPVNWHRPVYELDTSVQNNGFINEDFIVWMRTAALPTFRKLYRIIHKKSKVVPTLQCGNYTLEVVYSILPLQLVSYWTHIHT